MFNIVLDILFNVLHSCLHVEHTLLAIVAALLSFLCVRAKKSQPTLNDKASHQNQ